MHKNVTSPHLPQKQPSRNIVQKWYEIPGEFTSLPEKEAQDKVLHEALQPHFLAHQYW
jgi:hypothetical protein